MKKILSITILSIFGSLFLNFSDINAKATPYYIMDWNLLDSGKHLDVDGDSMYMNLVWKGMDTWNGYKSGVIRKDNASRIEDVFVKDIKKVSNANGTTYPSGVIELNRTNLQYFTVNEIKHVVTHELGHALGLAHSGYNDVMYGYKSSIIKLSETDKVSYYYAYRKIK